MRNVSYLLICQTRNLNIVLISSSYDFIYQNIKEICDFHKHFYRWNNIIILEIEFDEKLWHAVVDHVTVYHDDRLVYSLKDGTEITIEL